MKKKNFILYNVIFPLVILYYPLYEWRWLIAANYVIDTLIIYLCFRHCNIQFYTKETFKSSWKICIWGFIADMIGGYALVLSAFPPIEFESGHYWFYKHISLILRGRNTHDIYGYMFILAVIIFVGILIYVIDKRILLRHADQKTASKTALALGILTAPYMFFILPVPQL